MTVYTRVKSSLHPPSGPCAPYLCILHETKVSSALKDWLLLFMSTEEAGRSRENSAQVECVREREREKETEQVGSVGGR